MEKKIRIGSRDSVLAVKQANIVMDAVRRDNPNVAFELVTLKTSGDMILDRNLDAIGGKGLFIRELEQALAMGRVDIAVHSYKDMPCEETSGLPVVALSRRETPFDALVLPKDVTPGDLHAFRTSETPFDDQVLSDGNTPIGNPKPVGSSSLRRSIQFACLYKGFSVKGIRGNIPTRLNKLDEGQYSALILAQAGLIRLSLQHRIFRVFSADEMIPAGSQGILAVQGRQGEDYSYLAGFHSAESETVSRAERQFLKTLDGGCAAPAAVYGRLHKNEILLTGMYAGLSGNMEKGEISGPAEKAEQLGESLAMLLKSRLDNH